MPALLLYGWEVVTLPVKAKGFVPSTMGAGVGARSDARECALAK